MLDPYLVQETVDPEQWQTAEKEREISKEIRTERMKQENMTERRRKWLKDKDTEDGVNFRGKECNVPLIHH